MSYEPPEVLFPDKWQPYNQSLKPFPVERYQSTKDKFALMAEQIAIEHVCERFLCSPEYITHVLFKEEDRRELKAQLIRAIPKNNRHILTEYIEHEETLSNRRNLESYRYGLIDCYELVVEEKAIKKLIRKSQSAKIFFESLQNFIHSQKPRFSLAEAAESLNITEEELISGLIDRNIFNPDGTPNSKYLSSNDEGLVFYDSSPNER